jgi:hypothetical protein
MVASEILYKWQDLILVVITYLRQICKIKEVRGTLISTEIPSGESKITG